jgi:peptide/nickel transport system permease protein
VKIQNRKLRLFLSHKSAVFGLVIIFCIAFASVFPNLLSHQAPALTYDTNLDPQGFIKNHQSVARAPSFQHFMGTNKLGQDVYSNVVHGAQVSLRIGFIAVAISAIFGVMVGGLAGYLGGFIDSLLMRCVDVMLSFPSILLALMIVTMLGRGIENVMIAVGVAGIPRFARVMRAEVVTLRDREYVTASRALGANGFRIFFCHILPNSLGPLTVLASLGVATAVLEAAGLGFIGLGGSAEIPEWGRMLADNRDDLSIYPWLAIFPGLAIAITVLGFNLVGDGIRDAFDPTTTKR